MKRSCLIIATLILGLAVPRIAAAQSGSWANMVSPIGADQPPEPCDPEAPGEEEDEPAAIPCAPAVGVFGGWAAPAGAQTPLVLMDGSVFVHQARSLNWWKLTPDSNGDYANGTWTQTASMIAKPDYDYNPLYYCSAVLPDGRVVVMGGEYNYELNTSTGVSSYVVRQLNRGEIYNPYTDTWAKLAAPTGWTSIGDMMCTVMPSTGRLMLARQSSTQLATLNPATLTWTSFTPTGKTSGDSNSEEGWTLLPDGTVLVINANTGMSSQRFITSPTNPFGAGSWNNAGTIPVPLRDSGSHETGAQVLMYNGKVFAVGADRNTGSNAVYTPPPNTTPPTTALGSWAAAPPFPRKPYAATMPSTNCTGTAPNLMCQLDQADGPGVLMPNGRVLVNAGPGVFNRDTYWFEYEPNDNSLTEVQRPPNSLNKVQYQYHMVLLPSGQVFAPDGTATIPIYTPSGGPDPAWAPTITSFPASLKPGQKNYSLSGLQLNGLSEANSYGDDYASATNFPIIRITNRATGHVFWARTHDRDNLGVATGAAIITTQFDVPADLELGTSDLVVIANGIASQSVEVNRPPVTTASLSGSAGTNGWWVSDVQVTLSATDPDGAADIVATHYGVDGGAEQLYAGPFTVSGDANHVVAFWTEDTAGNRDTPARTAAINIDATKPTLTFGAAVPAANSQGWNSTSVDIEYTTADNFSGVASAIPSTPLHFGAEGAGQTRTVVVTDEAGNSASFTTAAINIDFTAPTISASPSVAALWPPTNKLTPDVISGQIADAGSGIDLITATFVVLDEYGVIQPTGPVTVGADNRYSFTLLLEASRLGEDQDGRRYQIVLTASDRAGNPFTTSTVVTVPHDQGSQ